MCRVLLALSFMAFYARLSQGLMMPTKIHQSRCQLQMQNGDIVERLFGFMFGEKALSTREPMGMRRINVESFPDQYPATNERWAATVKGDSAEVSLFRSVLAQTMLELRPLKCVYDSKRDGWSAAAFHRGVDKKGPGIVIGKTEGGAVIGGYNPKGWVGESEYRPGISAFLFTWPDGNTSKRPIKLRKIGGAGLAVLDKASTGPFFGSDALCVPMDVKNPRLCRSKLGSYYERMSNGANSIFAPSEKNTAMLKELSAYVGIYAKGEPIPFDDVIPLSIT